MNKTLKKILIALAVVAVFTVLCVVLASRKVENFSYKYEGADLSKDVVGLEKSDTYTGYIEDHADAENASADVSIDIFDYESEGDVSLYKDYEGVDECLYTGVNSEVTFKVSVKESGFYNLYVEYLLPESRGVAAERGVYINGELPFEDALSVTFTRIWTDGGEKKVDNQGNEIRPTQVEVYDWQTAYFADDRGYVKDPYKFYFEKGVNELKLTGENEPLIIKNLSLKAITDSITYEEYLSDKPFTVASDGTANYVQTIQGEDSTYRSESSLYAKYDRSSPTTVPNSVTHTVLNYVGGETWRSNGQWIEWTSKFRMTVITILLLKPARIIREVPYQTERYTLTARFLLKSLTKFPSVI